MLGLLYHHATLLALILIVTFSAHIFTNAILKNQKTMNQKTYEEKQTVPSPQDEESGERTHNMDGHRTCIV
jgi:hypothetical protein